MPLDFFTPYLKHVGLSSSGRPILNENEHDLIMKNEIGLYQDDYKVKYYQRGRLYLTNQRIIFVNDIYGNKNISLELSKIDTLELYNGFFKSSPKLILKLKDQDDNKEEHILDNEFKFPWVCPICSYSNDLSTTTLQLQNMKRYGNNLPLCDTCGVKCPYDVIDTFFIKSNNSSADGKRKSIDLLSFDGSQCPNCTFINHPSMTICEICGSNLSGSSSNHLNSKIASIVQGKNDKSGLKLTSLDNFNEINLKIIKFSFRNGNHKIFYESLKEILNDNHMKLKNQNNIITDQGEEKNSNQTSLNGIHGLTSNSKQQNHEDTLLLGKAVQDLDQLMLKARDLISLSKKYQNILVEKNINNPVVEQTFELLQSSKCSVVNLNHIMDNNKIGKSLVNAKKINALNHLKAGKASTDTFSKMPSLYLDELARNICDFLISEDILDKRNGMITLHELYSIYNKSRQINLISSEELYDSVIKFETLNINIKVTKIPISQNDETKIASYVYIISKKNKNFSVTAKILNCVITNPGISILKLQQLHFNMSFIILKTILDSMVNKGELTIDTSLGGDKYWPNEILNPNKNKVDQHEVKHDLKVQTCISASEISNIFKTSLNVNDTSTSDIYKDLHDLNFL